MKNKFWIGSLLLASIATAGADETSMTTAKTHGSDRSEFQIGLTTGATASPDAGPLGLGFSYGARVEYKPTPLFGIGLFAMHTAFSQADYFIATQSMQQTILGVEARFYPFSNDGLYVGGKVGASLLSTEITSFNQTLAASRTDLVIGGSVGYNVILGKKVSLAPEVSYLTPATTDAPGENISTVLNLNFWL